MNESDLDAQQDLIEYIILSILGYSPKGILSSLHIQKESFLIYKFHPEINNLLIFIEHYKGPFSRQIEESIKKPIFLENCWKWVPDKKDDLTGGYVQITDTGKNKFDDFIQSVKELEDKDLKDSLNHLLTGIEIVTHLYSKLTPEELLLLIYVAFPEMIVKSSVYDTIMSNKPNIALKLYDKKIIDFEKCKSLRQTN